MKRSDIMLKQGTKPKKRSHITRRLGNCFFCDKKRLHIKPWIYIILHANRSLSCLKGTTELFRFSGGSPRSSSSTLVGRCIHVSHIRVLSIKKWHHSLSECMSSSCFFHHLIKKQNCQTSHPANCHPDRPSHRRSKASTCEVANQTNKTSTSKLVVHYPFFFYISPDISIHR